MILPCSPPGEFQAVFVSDYRSFTALHILIPFLFSLCHDMANMFSPEDSLASSTTHGLPDRIQFKPLPRPPARKVYAPDESFMTWTSEDEGESALSKVKQSMQVLKLNPRRHKPTLETQSSRRNRDPGHEENATPRLPPVNRQTETAKLSVETQRRVRSPPALLQSRLPQPRDTIEAQNTAIARPVLNKPFSSYPVPLLSHKDTVERQVAKQTSPRTRQVRSTHHKHTRSDDLRSPQRDSYNEALAVDSTYASLRLLADHAAKSHPSKTVRPRPQAHITRIASPTPAPVDPSTKNDTRARLPKISSDYTTHPPRSSKPPRLQPIDPQTIDVSVAQSAFPANEARVFTPPDTPTSVSTNSSTSTIKPKKFRALFSSLRERGSASSLRRGST